MTQAYDSLGNRIYRDVNGSREAVCRYNAWNQLTSKTENGRDYSYTYDKRGNLTGEKQGERLIRQYVYDTANRMSWGEDLESGETTEYGYNGLAVRVKNIRKQNGYASGYQSYSEASGQSIPLTITRELQYVPDFTSVTHNDLMAVEKGYGATRITYGNGYERLSQKITLQSQQPEGVRAVIAGTIGKAYFQPDLTGSPLFAANEQGEVLRYAQRGVWGDLKLPAQEDRNASGVEESLRYTG